MESGPKETGEEKSKGSLFTTFIEDIKIILFFKKQKLISLSIIVFIFLSVGTITFFIPYARASPESENVEYTGTDPILTSSTTYSPASGITLGLSYRMNGWLEGSTGRPSDVLNWELGLEGGAVELSVEIQKWGIDESWSGTVDVRLGSRTKEEIFTGVTVIFEIGASVGDFEVNGPAQLEEQSLGFEREGEKSCKLIISQGASGGNKIEVIGRVYPQIKIGLKIGISFLSKTFDVESVSMPPMEPALRRTIYIPCNLTKIVQPSGGGYVEIDPAREFYEKGTEVNLTAHPSTDYTFDYWSGGHLPSRKEDKTITIRMDSDKSVTAHFVEVTESEGGGLEAPGEEWRIKGFPLWIVGILAFIGIALAFLAGRKL